MTHLKFLNVKNLYNIFDSLTGLLDSLNISIDKDGLYVRQMDSSHTCYIDLTLFKDDFEIFQPSNSDQEYGLLLKNFVNVLGSCRDADFIIIYINDNKFNLEFRYKNYVKNFELNTISIDIVQLEIPGCDYQCEIKLASIKYNNLIDTVNIMESNFIDFSLKGGELTISGVGDIGKFNQTYSKNSEVSQLKNLKIKTGDGSVIISKINNPEYYALYCSNNDLENSYSFKLMSLFKKSSKLSNNILINLNQDQPLKMDIMINDDTGSNLSFYLAPKT